MKQIENIERVIDNYKDWKPSDIAFIKRLELSMGNLVILFYSQSRSKVVGWPDLTKEFFEILITFSDVSNLKLELSNSKMHQITGFDILDIAENDLENMNYQVEDYENGSVSFFCKNVVIDRISEPCKLSLD